MDRYERALSLHRMLKSARYPVPTRRMMDELGSARRWSVAARVRSVTTKSKADVLNCPGCG